jgi:hypothetical protein
MQTLATNLRHVDMHILENPLTPFATAYAEWAALQDNIEFILKQLSEWTDESNQADDPLLDYFIQDARKRCLSIRTASPNILVNLLFRKGDTAYTVESCENYRQLTYTLGLICEKVAPDVFEALEENL